MTKSRGHNITIAFFLGASFVERVILQRHLVFCGMSNKTSFLLDKKMRKKNQIPKYYALSSKEYNEEDTRLFNEKSPNLVGILRKKTKRLIKCNW